MTAVGRHGRDEADLVILELIRLAGSEPWTVQRATSRLLLKHHSRGALRVALSRVRRAQAGHPSRIAERAASTLTATLATLAQAELADEAVPS